MARYLLIGNPNVGKSSFFNALTKSNVTVGNWSGVTVEEKSAKLFTDKTVDIYDLPGIYSLIPSSMDEGVVSRVIQNEDFNGVINIVDSTALKRNLHLTIQLLELGYPLVIAMNMLDELDAKGYELNLDKLSEKLGVKVFGTVASKNIGIEDISKNLPKNNDHKLNIYYGPIIEKAINRIKKVLPHNKFRRAFLALQILDGNQEFINYIKQFGVYNEIMKIVSETTNEVKTTTQYNSITAIIFEKRIEFINNLLDEALTKKEVHEASNYSSFKLDKILLNKYLAFPIFFAILLSMYFLTFNVLGTPISELLDYLLNEYVIEGIQYFITGIGINGFMHDLILDGLIAGVSQVIIFLPQILLLFFFLTALEGTGYMARVTIMFDRFFSRFDLNGKAIVPLITGMGCNVPAVMSTRTIVDKRDRLITILIIPFMSCSARIPIYVIFASAFFPKSSWYILFFMQLLGAMVALVSAKLLSSTLFKSKDNYFALEMPPYRLPQFRNVIRLTMNKGTEFIHGAGKFILIGSVVVWALSIFGPSGYNVADDQNFLALIGGGIAPIFTPLGFGTWQATSSLISGFLAKELVISSMAVLYGVTETGLNVHLLQHFTVASALSFMVFNLLYIPCLSTVGAIYQETRSYKWTFFSIAFSTVVAYILAFIVYNLVLIFI